MSAYQVPSDPTAVIPKRYVAAVIDVGIGIIVLIVIYALFSEDVVHYDYDSFGSTYGTYSTSRDLTGLGVVLFFGFWFVYNVGVFILQRGLTGRTLGTMAMGLVTVNERGEPLGIAMALARSVVGVVDYIGCCGIPLVGIITSNATKGHRRVGDLVAKSFVIEKSGAGQPVVVPGVNAPVGGPYAQPYGAPGQPYGTPGQPYGAPGQPYGTPGQPFGQTAYPPQPGYPTPPPQAPATPDTGWPGPTPATTPNPNPAPTADEAGWGAPGATDAPADQPGWGAAAEPAAAEPTAEPSPAAEVGTPGPEAAPDPTQPQWDPARNAYIQWDPDGQRWLQFDDATQQWRPIS